jgi:hypothetical protein
MTEGPNIRNEPITHVRTREERITDVLKLIRFAPPPNNAEEAFNLVNDSFLEIEAQENEPRMRAGAFRDMLSIKHNEKNLYYTWYIGHVLFIGENGAIELREKQGDFDREEFKKDFKYINKFNIVFSKLGGDNQGVW